MAKGICSAHLVTYRSILGSQELIRLSALSVILICFVFESELSAAEPNDGESAKPVNRLYQNELWVLAVRPDDTVEGSVSFVQFNTFANSVQALTDIHYKRVHSSVMN